MIVLTHPTGNRNVRALLTSLSNADLLACFYTTLSAKPDAWWLKMLPDAIKDEWLRREFPVLSSTINTRPCLELLRMLLPRIGLGAYVSREQSIAGIDAVYKDLDKSVARKLEINNSGQSITAVYAYEDGALATFKSAKKMGLTCIYDLPIAYWELSRKLMMEEAQRLPAWSVTLAGGTRDSADKLERKTEELELADVVITPGKFVRHSLPAWSKNKNIIDVPFGSPSAGEGVTNAHQYAVRRKSAPLRVLFVGSMGQRKGLGDLFTAVKLLNTKDLELVVMGSLMAPLEFYKRQLPAFTYEPGRPYQQVLDLMRTCDVLCLPSIVEGRALVMQEAMSAGLPLVITPNTGGEDLVHEGETGFLVPIRSPELIAEKLAWLLDHRCQIKQMGEKAKEHAAGYTWNHYGNEIINRLQHSALHGKAYAASL